MTIFKSRQVNLDPEPFLPILMPIEYRPRREQFDPLVNPILVAFRGRLAYQRSVNPVSTARLAEVWLANVPWYGGVPNVTPEQIDHARRVLTRLAALEA